MAVNELIHRAEKKDPNAMFELAEAYFLGDRGVSSDDNKAFNLYKELEILTPDDGMVLYRLGKCYEFGVGVDKDTNLALDYYQKAAEKGSGIACKTLGEFYKIGRYVQRDISKCLEYLNKGSKLKTPGSDEAAIMLGDMYHSGDEVEKNETKACDLYRIAADQGNSNAYYRLGMQTFNGWGVEADKTKGMEYWKKGAELNHWGCMYIIGVSYIEGKDLPKDIEKGLYWLEHSADRGLADSRCYLGKVYLRGLHGVPQDEEKGIQHLKAAAYSDQGQQEAMMIYGDYLYGKKTTDSLSEALALYQKAAELGEPAAYHRLGMLTYNGVGIEADKPKGIEYWKKGAELGQPGCMYIIGGLYMEGTELPQNVEQGLLLLSRAADYGMPDAHNYLGKVYLQGLHGVPTDETKALQHLKVAAEAGQVEAMVMLGDYYGGRNTDEDNTEATKWYEKAADRGVPYAARLAVLTSTTSAIIGAAPSLRKTNPLAYELNRDEWKRVADLAQKEIQLLQRGDFKGRDEQLEAAREDLERAKYEQAVCSYEMKEYHEAMDLLQGVLFRDSELLSALAHFWSEKGGTDEAFINTLREVVSAFLRLKTGEELKPEEEEIRATAASMIAEGYHTGIPGVLPQDMRQAEETLRKTIASLTDADWVQMLNDKLTQFGFNRGAVQPATTAPVPKEPEKPEAKPKSQPRQLPKADPNDKFGWARSEKEQKTQVTTDKQVQKQDTTGNSHQNGNGNSGTKTLLYVLIGLMSAVVILLFILVLKNHQKSSAGEILSPTQQTVIEGPVEEDVSVADADTENAEQQIETRPAAFYFLGRPLSELFQTFGTEYESYNDEGGTFLYYPDIQVSFGFPWNEEVGDETLVTTIVAYDGEYPLYATLNASMTYPEIEKCFEAEGTHVSEPERYHDELYDQYIYASSAHSEPGKINLTFEWDEDPYTTAVKRIIIM